MLSWPLVKAVSRHLSFYPCTIICVFILHSFFQFISLFILSKFENGVVLWNYVNSVTWTKHKNYTAVKLIYYYDKLAIVHCPWSIFGKLYGSWSSFQINLWFSSWCVGSKWGYTRFNVNSVTIVTTINLYIPVGLHINARNVYETKNEAGGELMRNNMFGANI
jgi:hypothetical protein